MAKKFKCDDDEFMIASDDEDEVVGSAAMHAAKKHPEMELSGDKIREMLLGSLVLKTFSP